MKNQAAIRAWNRYMRSQRTVLKEYYEFADADYKIDYGEFSAPPEPTYGIVPDPHWDRAFEQIAGRFNISPHELELSIVDADWEEQRRWLTPK